MITITRPYVPVFIITALDNRDDEFKFAMRCITQPTNEEAIRFNTCARLIVSIKEHYAR